ncbi:restriction endonuclease [Helicobacter pylori]|nr:restriction endonuclease [Helicobacter pylori]MUU47433.1 restriction endonuclease [Helicobacter pylori]
MHISGVKTAFKIADVEYVKDSTKLNFNYLKDLKDENNQSLSQNILMLIILSALLFIQAYKVGNTARLLTSKNRQRYKTTSPTSKN